MENTADLYKASNSFRRSNSSSLWMNNGTEIFSTSLRREEDEVALIWAAIQKLPSYNRLRKGLLTSSSGDQACEIDIKNLGIQERKILIDKLVRVPQEDNARFLLKLKKRIDRY